MRTPVRISLFVVLAVMLSAVCGCGTSENGLPQGLAFVFLDEGLDGEVGIVQLSEGENNGFRTSTIVFHNNLNRSARIKVRSLYFDAAGKSVSPESMKWDTVNLGPMATSTIKATAPDKKVARIRFEIKRAD
ncbi:MAG: DUF1425 domain-containing protein [Candidatus Brocadiia bacterium]